MNKITIILLYLIFIFFSGFLSSEENKAIQKAEKLKRFISDIDKIYFSFDTTSHEKLLANLLDYKQYTTDARRDKLNYIIGLEYHNLGKIYYVPRPEKAERYFEKSIEHLEMTIDNTYKPNSEHLALLSSSYGKKASFSTITALYWGYKSRDAYFDAYDLDSNNRKILLIGAIHLMHLPNAYGGDKQEAEKMLKKALALKYKADESSVNWGKDAEIFAYLAQLEILKEDKVKANMYIEKALKLESDYDFVKIDLKRQLEEL